MKNRLCSGLVALAFVLLISGYATGEELVPNTRVEPDYNGWGWTSYVMENGLITVAVTPVIGARVMQYDLGDHPSIYVNPAEFGKTYTLTNSSPWYNYGGYKNWPAPQDRWVWPPPMTLDAGICEAEITVNSPDSSVLYTKGPAETLTKWSAAKGLKFDRRLTIYKGSSRVRVDQILINQSDREVQWSVWDITQCVVNHPGEEDWDQFWVYFPIRKDSQFGEKGFWVMSGGGSNPQWKPNVAEGISAVQYLHNSGAKVGADSDGGWVSYVDERDGYTYAKRFPYFEGMEYPDKGSSVEVYTSNGLPYLEVEVLSPIVPLSPGGSYTFTEDWYAAKVGGPTLEVNEVGAIKGRLAVHVTGDQADLTGTYGIFYVGNAEIVFKDAGGKVLGTGGRIAVTPLETFVLDVTVQPPSGTRRIELVIEDAEGRPLGVLDAATVEMQTGLLEENETPHPTRFGLRQNVPNPFNPATVIVFDVPDVPGEHVRLVVYDLLGQPVRTLMDGPVDGHVAMVRWDGTNDGAEGVSSGVYFCQLRMGGLVDTRRMVLLR